MSDALDAIAHTYELRCAADYAFDIYAFRIGAWWPPTYTRDPASLENVTIEPRVGGRVYATHRGHGEDDWGQVTTWELGKRLGYTSRLGLPPHAPSLITVTFVPVGRGALVRFEHGGWTADNVAARAKFTDWPVILERFAAMCNRDVERD